VLGIVQSPQALFCLGRQGGHRRLYRFQRSKPPSAKVCQRPTRVGDLPKKMKLEVKLDDVVEEVERVVKVKVYERLECSEPYE
jgi:hypothetical protein